VTNSSTRDWSIYALTEPDTGEVRYIGKSVTPKERHRKHLRDRTDTHRGRWIRSLLVVGKRPGLLILETGTGDWIAAEVKWIAHYQSDRLTNATPGGEGVTVMGAESRAKLSAAQRALHADPEWQARWLAGRRDPEFRSHLSAVLSGKSKSLEHIRKLPQNNPGYKPRPEVAEKSREILRTKASPAAAAAPRTERQREVLREMSEGNKGKPGWAKGRVLSMEEREARSRKQSGVPKSAEHREKIRQGSLRRWARARGEVA
jgi:GIY-YIG catalytic domain